MTNIKKLYKKCAKDGLMIIANLKELINMQATLELYGKFIESLIERSDDIKRLMLALKVCRIMEVNTAAVLNYVSTYPTQKTSVERLKKEVKNMEERIINLLADVYKFRVDTELL